MAVSSSAHVACEVNGKTYTWHFTGVIVDPTTAGIGDSERALEYEVLWDDSLDNK